MSSVISEMNSGGKRVFMLPLGFTCVERLQSVNGRLSARVGAEIGMLSVLCEVSPCPHSDFNLLFS